MKTLLFTAFIFSFNFLIAQNINPVWQHVGPFSTNQTPNNPFRAGRIDDMTVDPANKDHIIVCGIGGGIWETYDLSTPTTHTWDKFPGFDNYLPLGIGCGGTSAVTFRNQNELFAAGCNAVFKYDYTTQPLPTWTKIWDPQVNVTINKIVFMPNDPNHVFLCTSLGLVESTNAGSANPTWITVSGTAGNIHSMAFVQKTTPGTYYWYIGGQNTAGNALLMESINGSTFTTVTSFTNLYTSINSIAAICLGNQTAANGDRNIYLATAEVTIVNNQPVYDRNIYKLTKNINTGNPLTVALLHHNGGSGEITRLIVGYDPVLNNVITGGITPFACNGTSGTSVSIGSIHADYHAVYINTTVSPVQIFLGTDGGFASVSWNGFSYSSTRINYGLNICKVNGFSGATESNQYIYGYQDHTVSDLYDESLGKVIAQNTSVGENDGGLIDKFDGNQMIIADNSSYGSSYLVSNNGATNFPSATSTTMYLPKSSPPFYYFEPNLSQPIYPGQAFGVHPFFQHPFRQGRIFAGGGKDPRLFQFDPVSGKFVSKVNFRAEYQHFLNSPTLKSSICNGCPAITPATPFEKVHYTNWYTQPSGMSFSQLDKNTMYIITDIGGDPSCCTRASQIIKYIGNNIDDIWEGYNDREDNNGNPQWQLVTPDWLNILNTPPPPQPWTATDIFQISFTGIETSNWDKNVVYVSCFYDDAHVGVPQPPTTAIYDYRVFKYDVSTGTATAYSNGIPPGDRVTSMIMDHASNDGIYISTASGVYYRDATMPNWVSYNTGPPGAVLPFVECRQMEINYRENTVRAGTYGRGIWKSDLVCPSNANLIIPSGTVSNYKEADDISTISGSTNSTITGTTGSTVFRATNKITLEPGFTADATGSGNYFAAFIHGCVGGSTSSYNYFRTAFDIEHETISKDIENDEDDKELFLYPNPFADKLTVNFIGLSAKYTALIIYNKLGEQVAFKNFNSTNMLYFTWDLSTLSSGLYVIELQTDKGIARGKVIKQ